MKSIKISNSLATWIALSLPIVLAATIPLLPTHDDWTSTPGPNPDPFSLALLLPRCSYWRIPESLYGWLVAHCRWLFPALGHVIVVLGHYCGCMMVYKLCGVLGINAVARGISTVFYLVTTGMIATLTACDGMSQTWVQTLGLAALLSLLKAYGGAQGRGRRWKWLVIVLGACFIKENAVAWFYVIPLTALIMGRVTWREVGRMAGPVLLVTAAYVTLRFTVPVNEGYVFNEGYASLSGAMAARGLALLVSFTWLPIDYAALLHSQHRNIAIVAVTLAMSLPFLYMAFCHNIRRKASRDSIAFAVAFLLCPAIHIATIFSLMHIYSGIGMAAMLLATLIEDRGKAYVLTFCMYATAAIGVDAHHYYAAYQSGAMGRRLTRQAIEKTAEPAERVFIISFDDEQEKYSNFYVVPIDAMGWGFGAMWETRYDWPQEVSDTVIARGPMADSLSQAKLAAGYDCVWIVTGDSVSVRK